MTQVSKYPITKAVGDRIFELFTKTLTHVKSQTDAEEIIVDLFTPTERIMLAKRLSIAFLLEKGYEFRSVQSILRVSSATVASVNTARLHGSNGYKKLIEKIAKEEKVAELLSDAAITAVSLPASGGKGSGLWRYLKEELKRNKEKNRKAL